MHCTTYSNQTFSWNIYHVTTLPVSHDLEQADQSVERITHGLDPTCPRFRDDPRIENF